MKNMVNMKLEDYDEMKDQIRDLKEEVKGMKQERIKELKKIFQLDCGYSTGGIYVKATDIIKELYGEEIEYTDKTYILEKGKLETIIYSVWKEKVEENEEEAD